MNDGTWAVVKADSGTTGVDLGIDGSTVLSVN
jgi:hypothetical protein